MAAVIFSKNIWAPTVPNNVVEQHEKIVYNSFDGIFSFPMCCRDVKPKIKLAINGKRL